jgi:signal transduction histidine kinase
MPNPLLIVLLLIALATIVALWSALARLRGERAVWLAEKGALERVPASQRAELQRHATAAERERIYRDLHDDLGAQLLDLVYAAPTAELADQARGTLQHMRQIVAEAQRPSTTLHLLLSELQVEAEKRLRAAGRELLWQQDSTLPDVALDQAATLHLARILREATTNALRHAALQRLRVRFYEVDRALLCDVTDDGEFNAAGMGSGTGTQSMQQRADQLGASIAWHAGTWGGTKVTLRMPLPRSNSSQHD